MTCEEAGLGYVAVRCADRACGGPLAADLDQALRESVRSSRHGILVVSGCTCGPLACRTRPVGPVVLVQPCRGNRPTGPAVHIGPVSGGEDVAAVRACLEHGHLDVKNLPMRLLVLHRRHPHRN